MKTVRVLATALDLHGERYEQLCQAAYRAGLKGADYAIPGVVPSTVTPDRTVPRQLPAHPVHFVGREAEMAALSAMAREQRDHGGVAVAAIIGTAGAGKTALAVHWAHRVTPLYPDGQLYVNLRGFDPVGTPLAASDAIGIVLDALHVPVDRIPVAPDAQIGLYRSTLAGRRMLIVLDNAWDEPQVRPLLPGSGGALVLVTSRRDLIGLAAADGARLQTLDVLPVEQAIELLTRRLSSRWSGDGPPSDQDQAVRDIARLCACLPLALSVAAARAAARPDRSLPALARSLCNASERLDVLATSDVTTNVRTVLSWSVRQLSPSAALVFDLLGLHPGPDVSVPAVVSLTGAVASDVRSALRELTEAHLLTEQGAGRFWMHDLLQAYAAERARTLDRARGQAAADRMLSYYTGTARAASAWLNPFRVAPDTPPVLTAGSVSEDMDGYRAALDWFDAEWRVLVAVIQLAAAQHDHDQAWHLAWAVADYLDWRGRWRELAGTQQIALTAARELGDGTGQADAHRTIGRAAIQLASFREAGWHLARALDLYSRSGRHTAAGRVQLDLGRTSERQGDYLKALRHGCQALALLQRAGDRWGQAGALNSIGWCHANLGDASAALAYCKQALELSREMGDQQGEACTLDSVGYALLRLGRNAEAIGYFRRSAGLYAELGNRFRQTEPLAHLGDALCADGRPARARQAWHDALAILNDLDHPDARLIRARLRKFPASGPRPAGGTGG